MVIENQTRPQSIDSDCPDLTKVCEKWDELPEAVKVGIMAMVDSF